MEDGGGRSGRGRELVGSGSSSRASSRRQGRWGTGIAAQDLPGSGQGGQGRTGGETRRRGGGGGPLLTVG